MMLKQINLAVFGLMGVMAMGSVQAAVCTVNNGLLNPPNANVQMNGVAGVPGLVIGVGNPNCQVAPCALNNNAGVAYVNGVAATLPAGTNQLNAVSVASTSYAVAVGEKIGNAPPPLVQFNGTTWSVMPTAGTPPVQDVLAVKTYGPTQTYAADKTAIYFFNGTVWTQQQAAPANANFVGMWGDATTIYVLADNGMVYRKAVGTPPTAWTLLVALNNPAGAQYKAITSDGAGNLYLTGQTNNGGFISKIAAATGAAQAGFPVLTTAQMNAIAVNPVTGVITVVGDANAANNANGAVATVNPNGTGLTQPAATANTNQINGVYIAPNGTTYMAGQTAAGCTAPVPTVDHIEIQHTGGGLTCSPATITLRACADAACATLFTGGGVTVTASPAGVPVTIGATGSATTTVQQSTAGAVLLSATANPAAAAATTCLNTLTNTASCAMTFSTAGFVITAPNHTACTNAPVTIEAMQAGTANRCVPAYSNVTQPVNLSLAYSNPTTGTKSAMVATGPISTVASVHNLAFDATGKATLALSYPDVGQVTLNANGTAPTGAAMTGSGMFIAAPAAFTVTAITAAPIKAGNNFNATLTAMTGVGTACPAAVAAPNFGKESTPQSVALTHALVSPVGGNAGLLTQAFGAYNNGASVVTLTWSEVGNINLNAALTGGAYLGYVTAPTGTAAVGRFTPEHFDTAVMNGCLGCGFTYSGQAFTSVVSAKNLAGGTTLNYDNAGGFAKAVTLSDGNANTVGTLSNAAVAATAFSAGVATLNNPVYTFAIAKTVPSIIKLRAVDADLVSSLRTLPAVGIEGVSEIRSGRMSISNEYGSELLPLTTRFEAQYWNGTKYVISNTDNASAFNSNLSGAGGNLVATIATTPLAMANLSVAAPALGVPINGVRMVTLNAPNVTGSADLSLNAPAYLLSGSNAAAINPSLPGRVSFGVYSGNKTFVYRGRRGR
ncbi:MAG: hypothetical protein PXX73_08215 [Sideroxydans sp.]|nr:hypothetical protein [Sideroxydans sp.]